MDEHVSKAVAKAIGKYMALRKICGVRPAQTRQMYMAAVVPMTDTAASVWYALSHSRTKRHLAALERVQHLASRSILRVYKSVIMLVLPYEAKLRSVSERLHKRVTNHLTKLCSLAPNYLLQWYMSWFPMQGSSLLIPLWAVYEKYETQLKPETGLRLSERSSWAMPPWQTLRGSVLYLEPAGSSATLSLPSFRGAYLCYVVAERQDKHCGAAMAIKYRDSKDMVRHRYRAT
jgi:hypothetical protein